MAGVALKVSPFMWGTRGPYPHAELYMYKLFHRHSFSLESLCGDDVVKTKVNLNRLLTTVLYKVLFSYSVKGSEIDKSR